MSVHSGNIPVNGPTTGGLWSYSSSRNVAATDLTPNGNDGTLNGAVLSGGCMSFDGVNDTVSFPHSSVYNLERTDSFTLMCLFKVSTSGFQVMMSKNEGSGNLAGWGLQLDSGKFELDMIGDISPTNRIRKQTTATYNDGNWHVGHATSDGSSTAAGVNLYVDGAAEATLTIHDNLTISTLNTSSMYLGQLAGFGLFYGGLINTHYVKKGVELTAAQVKAEYLAMKQGLHILC